jgi:hypothetical protein
MLGLGVDMIINSYIIDDNIPTDNLILYNEFNNNLVDATGNHTLTGNAISYTDGIFGGTSNESLLMSGDRDYITIPDSDDFSFGNGTTDSPFSISFGVNFTDRGTTVPATSVNYVICKRGDNGTSSSTTDWEWNIFRRVSSGAIALGIRDASASAQLLHESTTSLSYGTDYHITITYDGSGTVGGIKIYIDGVEESSYTDNSSGTYTAMENLNAPVVIGAPGWTYDSSDANRFNGSLEGLAIWDKELASDEVTSLYSKQNGGLELLRNFPLTAYDIGFLTNYYDDADIDGSGFYGDLVSPKMIYVSPYTYVGAVRDNATRDPVVLRYNATDDSVTTVNVGGITFTDPLDHQHPALVWQGSRLYVFQTDGHGENMRIFQSDAADITSGFSAYHTILGDYRYCSLVHKDNGQVYIVTAGDNVSGYEQRILYSNGTDYTDWTEVVMTDPLNGTTGNRHYPVAPRIYGTNSWDYIGISLRQDTDSIFFGQAMYKTQDFDNIYTLDGTFVKQISVDGVLTETEIENNLMLAGTKSSTATYISPLSFCVINDVVYHTYRNPGVAYVIAKIDGGTVTTQNFQATGWSSGARPFYNGTNLVFNRARGRIIKMDTDLTNEEIAAYVWDYNNSVGANTAELPANLDDVSGKYIIGGNDGDVGTYPYYITTEVFD